MPTGLESGISLALGIFLTVVGLILLVFLGFGWAEATRLGLQRAAIPAVVVCLSLFVSGVTLVASERGPLVMKDFLSRASEGGSPLWSHILGMLAIIALFFIGYSSDPLAYLFIPVILIAVINDIKKLGLEIGGCRWKTVGELLYLGVIAVSTALIAFANVVYAILGLAVFLAIAGFAEIPQGKEIKKHTVFKERSITFLVIVISLVAILLVFFMKAG